MYEECLIALNLDTYDYAYECIAFQEQFSTVI